MGFRICAIPHLDDGAAEAVVQMRDGANPEPHSRRHAAEAEAAAPSSKCGRRKTIIP